MHGLIACAVSDIDDRSDFANRMTPPRAGLSQPQVERRHGMGGRSTVSAAGNRSNYGTGTKLTTHLARYTRSTQ